MKEKFSIDSFKKEFSDPNSITNHYREKINNIKKQATNIKEQAVKGEISVEDADLQLEELQIQQKELEKKFHHYIGKIVKKLKNKK